MIGEGELLALWESKLIETPLLRRGAPSSVSLSFTSQLLLATMIFIVILLCQRERERERERGREREGERAPTSSTVMCAYSITAVCRPT